MHQPLVFFSVVLGLGIAAQWIAWRLKLPSILLLLLFGFLLGLVAGDRADLPGLTLPDEVIGTTLLFPLVSMAVAVIMFEGGMTLQFHELKETGTVLLRLVTLGALVAWLCIATLAYWLLAMDMRVAALTGAVLVVTGPTVIVPLLRHVRPDRRISSLVKWEGIIIDPVGAVLAVLVFDALLVGHAAGAGWILLRIIVVGTLLGTLSAWLLVQVLSRYWVPDYLHNPLFLAVAIGLFALSNQLATEAGLVTVTVLGIALANQRTVPMRHVLEFKENLGVLLISCLFVVLAARIRLDDFWALSWQGLVFVLLLIVVVRPLSVWIATLGTGIARRERLFLAFLAPRGIVAAAVSSVFALEAIEHLQDHHLVGIEKVVPTTFLVIVGTVTFYGLTAAPLARALGLAVRNPQGVLFAGAAAWTRQLAKVLHEEGIPVLLVDTNYRNIAEARMIGLSGYCASIVSEFMEEADLSGIGRLLAVTPNNDLNTLAAIEYTSVFGRANVYQLSPGNTQSASKRSGAATHLQGRYLFAPQATYAYLASRFASAGQVKKTKITDAFSWEDFQREHGENALVLFAMSDDGNLKISTADEPLTPKADEMVIALVDVPSPTDSLQAFEVESAEKQ